ncbi:MAG: tyrosine recombinase XerC [Clostridia bacterium]|nr:tyrosine recombinase XerC [Clostridia bacterium]
MKKTNFDDMPIIIQDFLKNYLKVAKGRSDLTISEYYYDLRDIFKFIKRDKFNIKEDNYKNIKIHDLDLKFFENITTNDLYEYLFTSSGKAVSRARKISSMKTFFNYLCNIKKIIDRNPCIGLESPKLENRLPKYLKLDEALSLLHSIDGDFKIRDTAIITLFLNCGLRLSELVNINLCDIKNDTISIIGKGNKERSIYLNQTCRDVINDYLKVRPVDDVKDKEALFLSKQRKRISPRMVELLVKKYIISAGLDPRKYTPHKLRHTAATLMHKHGKVDILTLQQILGHESIATTQIYTHIDSEDVKTALESNPLNHLS